MTELVPLDGHEAAALYRLEETIERGLATFVEVGRALIEIRDGRLYRETYGTFEDYCAQRWQFTTGRARQLVGAAEVAITVTSGNAPLPVPATERVARELAPVLRQHGEEAVREAWAEITAATPEPTAAQVRDHVRPRLPGPKTADKQAQETGLAVLASDGRWHTGRNDPPPYYEAIFRWAEEVARIPDAAAIDVPFYADGIDQAARTVRDYLDAFLHRLSQEAAA